jgi:predicted  nucleic acid-binding Zn-ribbon protein
MGENGNISKNGWSEYGRLVLKELERLNEGQDKLREDFDKQFKELNEKITTSTASFKNAEQDVKDLKEWREKVNEVWSTTQMKQSKDEIYQQKGQWQKTVGIVITVQIVIGIVLTLLKTVI